MSTDIVVNQLKNLHGDLESYVQKQNSLQRQVDAIDIKMTDKHVGGGFGGSGTDANLRKAFEDSGSFSQLKEMGKGKALIKLGDISNMGTKTAITESALGFATAGVVPVGQVGNIVPLAQRRLFARDLLFKGNKISTGSIYFIKETTFTNAASPQVSEGSLKGESADTFTTVTRPVATIAHWLPVSRQALDDMPMLMNFVQAKLLYGLRQKEETLILSGDGTNGSLTGLITEATAFDTALLGSSWNRADVLRRALQQVEAADESPAGFFVIHPDDWANIELQKDSYGAYLFNPRMMNTPSLWGRPVVVTTAILSGTFLCGSSEAAELFDRMDATLEISLDHSDYRAKNLAMILVECRTVLACYRGGAFIKGSFSTSP